MNSINEADTLSVSNVWSLKLGKRFAGGEWYLKQLQRLSRYRVSQDASDMLVHPDFGVTACAHTVTIVRRSVSDLFGFSRSAPLSVIFARAKLRGLALCPHEVGPLLRLRYKDQPIGEELIVAMEPIIVNSAPLIFTLKNTDTLILDSDAGFESLAYGAHCEFLFVQA